MPEIVDAFEKDGLYFGIIEIQVSSESKPFQFGISSNVTRFSFMASIKFNARAI